MICAASSATIGWPIRSFESFTSAETMHSVPSFSNTTSLARASAAWSKKVWARSFRAVVATLADRL